MPETPSDSSQARLRGGNIGAMRALGRMALAAALLGLLAMWCWQPVARQLAGLFGREMSWLDPTFRVRESSVQREGADAVFRVEVQLGRRLVLNGRVVDPDPRGTATASTLVGHALVPAIVLVVVAFAWPAAGRWGRALRVLALPPAVLLLWMIDVPLILLGAVWRLVLQALDPGRPSILWMWGVFLQGGGELAVAVVLGVLIGWLGASHGPGLGRKSSDCHMNDIMLPEH